MTALIAISSPFDAEPSPEQKQFNKLVARLEKLRQAAREVSCLLCQNLQNYGQEIFPIEQSIQELRKETLEVFYSYYLDKKFFNRKQKEALLDVMAVQLRDIMDHSDWRLEGIFLDIFKAIHGTSFAEMESRIFEKEKSEMERYFSEMGVEVDMSQFTQDMSREEILARVTRLKEANRSGHTSKSDQKKSSTKKAKKILDREEKKKFLEDTRTKSLSTLYRQLARLLHPDLELDPVLKTKKEVLMKELTVAYGKEDLYTLLRLDLEWGKRDVNGHASTSPEMLHVYNQALKEQVRILESERDELLHHPRYAALFRACGGVRGPRNIDLLSAKARLQRAEREMKNDLDAFKSSRGPAMVKDLVRFEMMQARERRMWLEFF